jgi:hypothetical protein
MTTPGPAHLPAEYFDLVDLYCSGLIDDDGIRRLESILLSSALARAHFVDYFHHHTEILFAVRADRAATAVLDQLVPRADRAGRAPVPSSRWFARIPSRPWIGIAAGVLVVAGLLALARIGARRRDVPLQAGAARETAPANIAWLVNAQDCRWAAREQKPGRDMQAGKVLLLERGLAEIEFDLGARVILQGPAALELLSGSSARLRYGTLTARVPVAARGFTVLSPGGKVVDLGTEFGLSVEDGGTTTLRVFKGEVEAFPLVADPVAHQGVTVHQDQTAQIDGRTVALETSRKDTDETKYVRAITPPPVVTPRTLGLDFSHPVAGTLLDATGQGVGLTHRLPGTGAGLPARDSNLRLQSEKGALELTTTRSDLNTQERLATGEYLGVRLADLGYTGREDFEISATIADIPGLKEVGQFGLYAGARSDANIRGGLISRAWLDGSAKPASFRLFLVKNNLGIDSDIYEVGLMTTGDHLRLTLRRIGGRYSLVVDNLTRKSSSTLEIPHPGFLDQEHDLYVGLFGANTQSDLRKTLTIRDVRVTVWMTQVESPAIAQRSKRH